MPFIFKERPGAESNGLVKPSSRKKEGNESRERKNRNQEEEEDKWKRRQWVQYEYEKTNRVLTHCSLNLFRRINRSQSPKIKERCIYAKLSSLKSQSRFSSVQRFFGRKQKNEPSPEKFNPERTSFFTAGSSSAHSERTSRSRERESRN